MAQSQGAKPDHALRQWLGSLGLEQYAASFERNDVGLELLPELSDADFEKLGLSLGKTNRLFPRLGS